MNLFTFCGSNIINVYIVPSPQRPDGADVDGAAVAAVTTAAVCGRRWRRGRKASSVGAITGCSPVVGSGRPSVAQRLAAATGAAPRPVATEAPCAAALLPLPAPRAPQRVTPAASPAAFAFAQASAVNSPRWSSLDYVLTALGLPRVLTSSQLSSTHELPKCKTQHSIHY